MAGTNPIQSADGHADPTRQMLEELDALMERMLSLPVNDLESLSNLPKPDLPDLSPGLASFDPSAQVAEDVPDALAPPSVAAAPPPAARIPSYSFSEQEREQADANPFREQQPSAFDQQFPQEEDPLPPPLILKRPEPVLAPAATARLVRPAGHGVWLQPLQWANNLFDQTTQKLGGLGAWLRGQHGRAVLGFLGLAFLLLALLLWLRDWFGL